MENQQQREAEEQILSEAFDLVHEIAIGSDKDWENVYKTLAIRREIENRKLKAKLQAYQRAVEKFKGTKLPYKDESGRIEFTLGDYARFISELEAIQ